MWSGVEQVIDHDMTWSVCGVVQVMLEWDGFVQVVHDHGGVGLSHMVEWDTKERLAEAVGNAKEALARDDSATFNAARDELMQAFSAAGQEMYQSQGSEADGDPPDEDMQHEVDSSESAVNDSEEEVVEADYEIVD